MDARIDMIESNDNGTPNWKPPPGYRLKFWRIARQVKRGACNELDIGVPFASTDGLKTWFYVPDDIEEDVTNGIESYFGRHGVVAENIKVASTQQTWTTRTGYAHGLWLTADLSPSRL